MGAAGGGTLGPATSGTLGGPAAVSAAGSCHAEPMSPSEPRASLGWLRVAARPRDWAAVVCIDPGRGPVLVRFLGTCPTLKRHCFTILAPSIKSQSS